MLMIFDCIRNDPEKGIWLWILIFLNVPGAIIYFLVRRAPSLRWPMPQFVGRWTRRTEIWNAEAAARNIGKSHQFVNLANVLLEIGNMDEAAVAYQQALEREPQNIHALWGLASIDMARQHYESARDRLFSILQKKPDFKFGEASLVYGQALVELEQWDDAKVHLEEDLKRWSHPEASVMLASIHIKRGEPYIARNLLETMMSKVRASPKFHYRKKRHLVRKAQRMLKVL